MLVLSMNSKRLRRPNVRLEEIGDVSAAFACGISQKTKKNLGQKRWKHDFMNPMESDYNPICGFSQQKLSEFTVPDPGVSPRILDDMQQNRENNNPNSLKSVFEFARSDEINMSKSKLNFGTINRKCRQMKRQRRSTRGNCGVFGGAWDSKMSSEISIEDGKDHGGEGVDWFTSNSCFDIYNVNGFKDSSDHETSATSKEACENDIDELTFNVQMQGPSNEFSKEGACYEGNNAFPQSFGECDKIKFSHSDVNSVRQWLEELGFGKYAGVFEMHEVDEEALPLLTFEDLKEMGVIAIGPRRKLYTAIQQLRRGGERVSA
uniref:SAM domain-containing protein n=1 Tax=Davidia involucrata TaxID=16924 RepID=A0A5B7AG98_DAVIN